MAERYGLILIACATLGLAPFVPEPHLWGKLRWVMGGAVGMTMTDWFDLLMHGSPFIALLAVGSWDLLRRRKRA